MTRKTTLRELYLAAERHALVKWPDQRVESLSLEDSSYTMVIVTKGPGGEARRVELQAEYECEVLG